MRHRALGAGSSWLALPFSALALVSAGDPPAQSPWQKALFSRVESRARELSAAAEPALLARLGSPEFRARLSSCCPESATLPAAALLRKLQEETLIAEYVSSFPSGTDPDPDARSPGGPGVIFMSIEDGMTGSLFENQWEATFRHNQSFAPNLTYYQASCSANKSVASIEVWSTAGCLGPPTKGGNIPTGTCIESPDAKSISMFDCVEEQVMLTVWQVSLRHFPAMNGLPLDQFDEEVELPRVPCPHEMPVLVQNFTSDRACRALSAGFNYWELEDLVEMGLYGLKPFSKLAAPQTFAEVEERAVYTLVNSFLMDTGSPSFGDVTAVFSAGAMRSTALLHAVDTGLYSMACSAFNRSGVGFAKRIPHNCGARVALDTMGTAEHFNHLLLLNDDFWNASDALAGRFARLEGAWGSRPLRSQDINSYIEALPAGQLRLPDDVRFLIGTFSTLFGTAEGQKLQEWAGSRGWVLTWSLGINRPLKELGHFMFQVPANQRLADPRVAANTTAGASLPLQSCVLRTFDRHWAAVERLRAQGPTISNETWADLWHQLREDLPAGLRLGPLRAGSCPRGEGQPECVGLRSDGACVCYSALPTAADAMGATPHTGGAPQTPHGAAPVAAADVVSPIATAPGIEAPGAIEPHGDAVPSANSGSLASLVV